MIKDIFGGAGLVVFSEIAVAFGFIWLTWKHVL
jgi:hypothetical protein